MPDADVEPEDDAGWSIAMTIRDRVLEEHPRVAVDAWTSADRSYSCLTFIPANAAGVSVTVYVHSDETMEVEAGAAVLEFNDHEDTLDRTVRLVLSFAANGYSLVRTRGFLGRFSESHAGPSAGFMGLDELADQPFASVVEFLDPWAGTVSD